MTYRTTVDCSVLCLRWNKSVWRLGGKNHALLFLRTLFHPVLIPLLLSEHQTQHLIPNENTRNPITETLRL